MNIGILEYDGNTRKQLMDIVSNECPKANVISWEREEELKKAVKDGTVYKILFLSLEKEAKDIISYSKRLQDRYPGRRRRLHLPLRMRLYRLQNRDPLRRVHGESQKYAFHAPDLPG